MPLNHRMTRDDDADQTAGNPSGSPDRRQYDDHGMSFNDLVGELKDLMNQDRASQLAKGRKASGCWFGESNGMEFQPNFGPPPEAPAPAPQARPRPRPAQVTPPPALTQQAPARDPVVGAWGTGPSQEQLASQNEAGRQQTFRSRGYLFNQIKRYIPQVQQGSWKTPEEASALYNQLGRSEGIINLLKSNPKLIEKAVTSWFKQALNGDLRSAYE